MRITTKERKSLIIKLPKCPYDEAENCMHSKLKQVPYYPNKICEYMLIGRCQNAELACKNIWSEKWK